MQKTHVGRKLFSLLLILSTLGALVSIYYIHHFQKSNYGFSTKSSFCSINEFIDCDAIQFTWDAQLFGIPIGAFVLLFFLVYIQLLMLYNRRRSLLFYQGLRVWSLLGILVAIQKAFMSFVVYQVLCLTCMFGWLILLILFLLSWFKLPKPAQDAEPTALPSLFKASGLAMLFAVFSILLLPNIMISTQEKQILKESSSFVDKKVQEGARTLPESYLSFQHPEGDYTKGDPNAAIQIISFHDFECPFCRKTSRVFEKINLRFPDQIFMVFKNYPLDAHCNPRVQSAHHPQACYWAQAARCVGQKNPKMFWKAYQKINKTNLNQLELEDLVALAPNTSKDEIEACITEQEELMRIQTDIFQAQSLNISGSPTYYINGYRFEGFVPFVVLEKFISHLLKKNPKESIQL